MVECDDAEPESDNEDEQRVEGDAYFFEGIPIEERYGPVSQTDMAHAKNGVPGNFAYRTLMGPNNEIKTMLAGHVVGNDPPVDARPSCRGIPAHASPPILHPING